MSDDDNIIRFPHIERIDLEPRLESLGKLMRQYTLVNRTPMPVDYDRWAHEMEKRYECAKRTGIDPWRVAETVIGGTSISTEFLGLNHRFIGSGPPLLFETMIFGGRLDNFQDRCSTWDEAEAMHAEAVALVRQGHLRVIK